MKAIVFRASSMLVAAILLAACSNSIPQSVPVKTSQSSPVPTAQLTASAKPGSTQALPTAAMTMTQVSGTPVPTAAGEAAGVESAAGEAAVVTYADAAQGYSIARPASWTQDMSVKDGLKFDGGDGSMTLAFAKTAVKDVLSFATNDVKTFAAASPSFKQVGLALSTEVANAAVLGFTTTGTSQVTGKTYAARGDRYYIALKDGRIAVLTFVSSVRNYDREGIRDIALTLKVTK